MANPWLLARFGPGLAIVLKATHEKCYASTLDELIALEHALSAQIEAIGERCVSLWGKGS